MSGRPRILLVDDDSELRQSLCDVLEDEGYDTVGVGSGREALSRLRAQEQPRLILLDLMMPDMNGWEFRETQLRDPRLCDIPVLIVTASRNLGENPIAAEGLLLKPFSLQELLEKVATLLAEAPATAHPPA